MNRVPMGGLILSSLIAVVAVGQTREETIIRTASEVLREAVAAPLNGIPKSMLRDAYGVAIIPNLVKGGFVIGGQHGRGVLVMREATGAWYAPMFVTLTGGNIGFQAGIQSADVILVFKSARSLANVQKGKLTLGADAAVAAGPVGREAGAGTDLRLNAEVYSYSRSRGLFAGVAIDGSVIAVDRYANNDFYRPAAPGQPAAIPDSAARLAREVEAYCVGRPDNTPELAPPAGTPAPAAPRLPPIDRRSQSDLIREKLAAVAPELFAVLDEQWRGYLALPREVFHGSAHPPIGVLKQSLAAYEAVNADPRYRQLAGRPEFQSTYSLLKHYVALETLNEGPLDLPPPPGR